MTFIENSTVIIHKEVRENNRALGDDKNDNFKSLYSPYFIANMKYFDSDTDLEDDESEENREFFKKIHRTLANKNTTVTSHPKSKANIEELIQMQKIFEEKINIKRIKLKKDLEKIYISEGKHFGIPCFFILLCVIILFANEILRGESEGSFIGVYQ